MGFRISSFRTAVFAVAVLGLVPAVLAQTKRSESGFLPRGARQWMILGAVAEPLPINSLSDGRTFIMQAVTWGQIMTQPGGPGPLRGQLEWGVELEPAFIIKQQKRTYAIGGSPIFFRWWVRERHRVAPYAEIMGGSLYNNHEIPENVSRFNFTAQAGVGFRVRTAPGHSLVLGYRLHHISNGGLGPHTPSVNSNVFVAGVTF